MGRSSTTLLIAPAGKHALRNGALIVLLSLFLLVPVWAAASPVVDKSDVMVLCYHNIGKDARTAGQNVITITQQTLRDHFEYLKQNGYHVIRFQDYLEHYKDGRPLPPQSVLLTFDDGYSSMYEMLFPLLKEYRYPALVALVTEWMSSGFPQKGVSLLTWDQVRTMDASGLVEFASHTHNQHRWGSVNRYGDQSAFTSGLLWANGRYETPDEHRLRIYQDLLKAQEIFRKELGHPAKALVWPYGEFSGIAVDAAQEAGFQSTFSVSYYRPGPQNHIMGKRVMLTGSPSVSELKELMENGGETEPVIKLVQLDLDSVVAANNSEQTEKNLRLAVAQALAAGANRVALQVFVDTKATGNVQEVYFQNSQVPVKLDILGHAAAQFQAAGILPFAWAPSLAVPALFGPAQKVQAVPADKKGWYDRATPFSSEVAAKMSRFYEEMAMYAPALRGVLIQDDLYLNDFEDFSADARAAWMRKTGTELTPSAVSAKAERHLWTEWKTDVLDEFSQRLVTSFRRWRPEAVSARNIYADPVQTPESQEWFAQKLANYLRLYEYTVVMTYPYMEKQENNAISWMTGLASTALQVPGARDRLLFKLQAIDWNTQKAVPAKQLTAQMRALRSIGARHFGIYPLDPFNDSPTMLFPR